MSRIRIYVEPQKIADFIKIKEMGVVHKLKNVLRLSEGDEVFVFNGQGKEYSTQIKYLQNDSITLRLGAVTLEVAPRAWEVDLIFPLSREEKVDFILQKAVELGVSNLIPFVPARGIKIVPSSAKLERWNNIVKEAVRQSQRLWFPKLFNPVSLDSIITQDYDCKILADVSGVCLEEVLNTAFKRVLLIVGPEGDFSNEEKESLRASGFKFVNIGENVLRFETAAIFLTGLSSHILHKLHARWIYHFRLIDGYIFML